MYKYIVPSNSRGGEERRDIFAYELGHVLAGNVSHALHGQHVEDGVSRLNVVSDRLDDELGQVVGGAYQD